MENVYLDHDQANGPFGADFVAKVCDWAARLLARFSWNGSHHSLFLERRRCVEWR
jgi:hypothetical protein